MDDRSGTLARNGQLLSELDGKVPTGEFFCDHVDYAVADEQFRFHRVAAMPLGSPAPR